jgi:hypothetical protein
MYKYRNNVDAPVHKSNTVVTLYTVYKNFPASGPTNTFIINTKYNN